MNALVNILGFVTISCALCLGLKAITQSASGKINVDSKQEILKTTRAKFETKKSDAEVEKEIDAKLTRLSAMIDAPDLVEEGPAPKSRVEELQTLSKSR